MAADSTQGIADVGAGDAELLERAGNMVLGGARGDGKDAGDVLVGGAGGEEFGDLLFPQGQAPGAGAVRACGTALTVAAKRLFAAGGVGARTETGEGVEGLAQVAGSCVGPVTVIVEGHRGQDTDPIPAVRVRVCAGHAAAQPMSALAGLRPRAVEETSGVGCGVVLDYRGQDEVLRTHAELWLTPLTGVRPADHGGNWAAVLHAAHSALEAEYPTAEGEAYESTATSLALAAQMAEDLDVEGADEERG